MKIQNITSFSIRNNTRIADKKYTTPSFKNKYDQISFSGNNKGGIFNAIKKLINGTSIPQVACYIPRENTDNLSSDEIKSEKIKKMVGETVASYHTVNKKGKSAHSEIKEILKMGRSQNYKGTLDYNPDDRANVVFGQINPDTNLPSTISMWKEGEFMYSYDILSADPIEYELTVLDNGVDTIQHGIGDTVDLIQQKDLKFHLFKQFEKTQNGFTYSYGHLADEENAQIEKKLFFDFYDIRGCVYAQSTDEGVNFYTYNQEQDLWEIKRCIKFEDLEQYI